MGPTPARAAGDPPVRVVKAPPTDARNKHYLSNRDPLAPSPLVKLPIGSITPRGWLRRQLELELDGMTGRLPEVSQWCRFEGNAWSDPTGKGHSGWEEAPYWLKGYGDLGYVMKDERVIKEARRWIEAILASQDETGWFGPRSLLTSKDCDGKPDLWPNMLALNVLQSYYEYSGDPRVLPFMARYFKWELNYPEKDFLLGYWPKIRGGDNLESIYWLYNRTGEKWLLDVAEKVHRRTANWTDGVANWHGVNFCQGFREPGVYWVQSKDPRHLAAAERNYREAIEKYGQVPGGMFGADENARPGYHDPRNAAETCSMVEFMHSFEMLTRITGDPLWADRCEDVAFNSFPASQTPDLKALHYLTSPNMVQLDRHDKSPGIQNGGTMFSFSPGGVYRCCQHNVSHGWPYFAEELWLATTDNGLCASLFSASEVAAKVGADGTEVKVLEETRYPFEEAIEFAVSAARPVRFPLYLRLPRWCSTPGLAVNGKDVELKGEPQQYAVIDREWAEGDKVRLSLPMSVSVRRWEKNRNSASVDRGPLTYSLRVGETWKKYGGSEQWPEQEVLPATPWNYGLVLDEKEPAKSFQVAGRGDPPPHQPWVPDGQPIVLLAKAKKIPEWKTDAKGLIRPLPQSPVKSAEPVETIALIPMGAARLRISQFPVIGEGADAKEWRDDPPPAPPVSASHVFGGDTVEALIDGAEPKNSNDQSVPRFTWWDHKGSEEWVQWDFKQPRKVAAVQVYWFDDRPTGGCRVPASWQVLYRDNPAGEWKPVNLTAGGSYGVERDKYNRAAFEPVEAAGLRVVVKLQPGLSGGILEWRAE